MHALISSIHALQEHPLRHRVFGAERHGWRSQPVSESELRRFEQWCGGPLQSDYRTYLLEIGTGVGPYYGLWSFAEILDELTRIYGDYDVFEDPDEIETPDGTGRVCWNFSSMLDDAAGGDAKDNAAVRALRESTSRPGTPFASEAFVLDLMEHPPRETEAFDAPGSPGGFIPICSQGCEYLTVMVTSGACAGRVFDVTAFATSSAAWRAAVRPPGIVEYPDLTSRILSFPKAPSFADWIHGWVEQCHADFEAVQNR